MTGAGFLDRERELQRRAEQTGEEFLWLWELRHHTVVVGRSGKMESEVNLAACNAGGIPVLRRDSGGGAVLLGPGCLNYTLVLAFDRRPQLRDVEASYRLILHSVARATGIPEAEPLEGDLTIARRKFGGSSQRRRKRTLLHHGTILYDFDFDRIQHYLQEPPRQPGYRQHRTHAQFLTNGPLHAGFANRLQAEFPETQRVS